MIFIDERDSGRYPLRGVSGAMRIQAVCSVERREKMAKLEELKKGALVKGIRPDGAVSVVDVNWHGSDVVELFYKEPSGSTGCELLYRDREPTLEILQPGRAWSFDGDGALFRLAAEARRIRLAHLFDPRLAVHTSLVEPLPHQITAVYGEMLPRRPLRFLLADDPGAGKTIMTGLLLKELITRGDVQRCLICCPGNLNTQWQDELYDRFHLHFDIISKESFETARTGNPFVEKNFVIVRLDQMSRNEDFKKKLVDTDWDLVVCDEAHKMSASYYGTELKETDRRKLGKLLGGITRHFLLLTATPHNGKEGDFQLFMALLDEDRFEGKYREGVHVLDTKDMMRRMMKEHMYRFNGTHLFPERKAYTVNYKLSDQEANLYSEVTRYVREEMNRADRLIKEGEGRRANTVGFALTILQRRLASSPEAIWCSLKRRIERLEKRVKEEELLKRGAEVKFDTTADIKVLDEDDLDEATAEELEDLEDEVVDLASAAKTIAELRAEIGVLKELEKLARAVRNSGTDKKWEELSCLLQEQDEMFDTAGSRRKLVVFTEHKDTLRFLTDRVRTLLGREEAVVVIHGSLPREERRKVQEKFIHEKDVQILVATDAAGEGINLQRANLMVNYDLPWNPNRIEQRFGRIHRIGQLEVCHLWNMVAEETREGDVFSRLLSKLQAEREALGGQVFDVLGQVFREKALRSLLIEAIRYGERPEVRDRIKETVDDAFDRKRLKELIESKALVQDSMDISQVQEIREEMERAEARKLQPHFIASFFIEAFKRIGGTIHKRETGRFEITNVPSSIRFRDRQIGTGEVVLQKYERVTFHKELVSIEGKPMAAFLCPGHPLLDAVINLVQERHRDVLKRGAVLVDPQDEGEDVKALFFLEHEVQDGRKNSAGNRRSISRRMHFVTVDKQGEMKNAGYAPYLDWNPISEKDRELCDAELEAEWLRGDMEPDVLSHAIEHIVPEHIQEVRTAKIEILDKTVAAVKDRLTKEINYWDQQAEELKMRELAGKKSKLTSGTARQRADNLEARLRKREDELEQERNISALSPVVTGGAIVIPVGLLERLKGERVEPPDIIAKDKKRSEMLAMTAVMEAENKLGFVPRDVSKDNCGYDIESRDPDTRVLRFIEVKGRAEGQETVTITKNEILTALNKPDNFILAMCIIPPLPEAEKDKTREEMEEYSGNVKTFYLREPFSAEPDFGVTSVNYNLKELLSRGGEPS